MLVAGTSKQAQHRAPPRNWRVQANRNAAKALDRQRLDLLLAAMPAEDLRKTLEITKSCKNLLSFVPNRPQWQVFKDLSEGKFVWFYAGNRTGKTEAGTVWLAMNATRVIPYSLRALFPPKKVAGWLKRKKFWVVSPDLKHALDGIIPKMHFYFPKGLLRAYNENQKSWTFLNGTVVRLKSCEATLDQFEGADIDGVVFDEEPPEGYFKACLTRCVDRGGWHFGAMTPLHGMSWTHEKIYLKKLRNIAVVIASTWDNAKSNGGYLDDEQIQHLVDSLDPHEVEARIHANPIAFSGMQAFDPLALGDLAKEIEDPERFRVEGEDLVADPVGAIHVFRKPEEGHGYVIGCDPSLGVPGADFTVVQVLEAKSREQVATYHGHVSPDRLGTEILPVLGDWYNMALVVVESNNHGLAVTDALRRTHYSRIYKQWSKDRLSRKWQDAYGFNMNQSSKNAVIGRLHELILRRDLTIHSSRTIQELQSYIKRRDPERYEAGSGHDDEVTSLAIACFVTTEHVVEAREKVPELPVETAVATGPPSRYGWAGTWGE